MSGSSGLIRRVRGPRRLATIAANRRALFVQVMHGADPRAQGWAIVNYLMGELDDAPDQERGEALAELLGIADRLNTRRQDVPGRKRR